MSLRTADYEFVLPDSLIAQYPADRRDASRLMQVDRKTGSISHHHFGEIRDLIPREALLVLNNAKVVPARFFSDDARVEFLFLERLADGAWKCLVKPGRRMREGVSVIVDGNRGAVRSIEPDGERVVVWDREPDLAKIGVLPLPPYVHHKAGKLDHERYQTVYASQPGAIAAPTAGLHFTPEILAQFPRTFLTLHVGVGTFKPVQADTITEHPMHTERFEISPETARTINAAEKICAIGTTTVRVLEGCERDQDAKVIPQTGETRIFLHPPMTVARADLLLTNFHLPRSTLLMLVSAFATRELMLEAYAKAVENDYRFFSYGDCMLIV